MGDHEVVRFAFFLNGVNGIDATQICLKPHVLDSYNFGHSTRGDISCD